VREAHCERILREFCERACERELENFVREFCERASVRVRESSHILGESLCERELTVRIL
jgi:hypothetical protein